MCAHRPEPAFVCFWFCLLILHLWKVESPCESAWKLKLGLLDIGVSVFVVGIIKTWNSSFWYGAAGL